MHSLTNGKVMLSFTNLLLRYLKSPTTHGISLFFLGIAIAGLEYPDKPFFKIPNLTNLSISLSIFDFISSFTVKGLIKMGFYQSYLNVPACEVLDLFHHVSKTHLCISPISQRTQLFER